MIRSIKYLMTLSFMMTALVLAGCASTNATGAHNQNYDFSTLKRVAVVAVEGASVHNRDAAQNAIANIFNQYLMTKGYSPVERSQIKAVIDEQNFSHSSYTSTAGAAKLGRILNVDAAIILNIPRYGQVMEMSAKMVDVDTAAIIWSANGSASTGSGLNKAAGALLGAVSGAVVGHQVDDTGYGGTVVGGAVGGAGGAIAGSYMTPQRQEQANELIKELVKTLPSA